MNRLYPSQINWCNRLFCSILHFIEDWERCIKHRLITVYLCGFIGPGIFTRVCHSSVCCFFFFFFMLFCRRTMLSIMDFAQEFQESCRFNKLRESFPVFLLLAKKPFFSLTQHLHQQTQIIISDLEGLHLYGRSVDGKITARHLSLPLRNGTARLHLPQKISCVT